MAGAAPAGGGAPAAGGAGPEDEEETGLVRWLAYTARVKAIVAKKVAGVSLRTGALRYVAFTSDFGEAFRPAVPRWVVNASYATSVAYIGGTVCEAGMTAHSEGKPMQEVQIAAAQEACFQFLASLFIPFLLIHTAVHRTAVVMKRRSVEVTRPLLAKWGPSGVGLACVPLLPTLVDHPCEHAVEAFFAKYVRKEQSLTAAESHKYHKQAMHLSTLRKYVAGSKVE